MHEQEAPGERPATSLLSRRSVLGLAPVLAAVLVAIASPTLAADDVAKSFEMLRVGDDEARAIALIGRQPDRTQRTTVLGAQKVVLQFDISAAQYELVFHAGYLTSKTVRTRKPGLLDGWGL